MNYFKAYDAMLDGFEAPVFPKIVKIMNAILWTHQLDLFKVREILENVSQAEIELREVKRGVKTSDGYSWPLGFFHAVRFSSFADSAILFPIAWEEDLFDKEARSIAVYLSSSLAGNRKHAVQNALGNLLIDLSVFSVELVCDCELHA